MDGNDIDPAIIAALPSGRIISMIRHGNTNWSTGYKLELGVNGQREKYFLKVLECPRGDEMARGEFESQKALDKIIPEAIVPPVAWDKFQNDRGKAFYLTYYRSLKESLPTMSQILPIIKALHKHSVSPTGKFGFHVTTFWGPPPMDNSWTGSWEQYFTRNFRASLEYGQGIHGEDDELCSLGEEFVNKVIPRLLRPLQTGGRTIKPTLCHGDLWDANVQIDESTGKPILFDPCCFYGHHEMDFQSMRATRNKLGQDFVNAYRREVGASEPIDDFDDRNALYSMRADLDTAGMYPRWRSLLDHVKEEMRRLINKHPNGIDGFDDGL